MTLWYQFKQKLPNNITIILLTLWRQCKQKLSNTIITIPFLLGCLLSVWHPFQRKLSKWNIALICTAFFFLCTSLFMGYHLVRMYRVNLFSNAIAFPVSVFHRETEEETESTTQDRGVFSLQEIYLEKEYYKSRLETVEQELSFEKGNLIVSIDVPHINQNDEGLPNGCEAVSAVILLRYAGYDISTADFVDKYLPMEPVFQRWGFRYGPNPEDAYAGDPRSKKGGWGCFVSVIESALKAVVEDAKSVTDYSGMPLADVARNTLSRGIPVAIWVTQKYSEVDNVYQWQSYDKTETYRYPVGQHCVVLKGYDGEFYYIDDPLKDEEVKIEKAVLEKSFASMGFQAVGLQRTDKSSGYSVSLREGDALLP